MKRIISILSACCFVFGNAAAQTNARKATLGEDGRLYFENIHIDLIANPSTREFTPLSGFPFGHKANPTFKNTRGATLADVDGDGQDEILFGADSVLYCLNGDGSVLWTRATTGTIILAPTVGDMDGDGSMEIAINVAGIGALGTEGGIYLVDGSGEDLAGWPKSYSGHWMMNAPVMADVDGDGIMELISGERVNGNQGFLHVLTIAGQELDGWPVETPGNVAFTPSVGDINTDGVIDIVSGISSDGGLYAYDANGNLLPGFPQIATDGKLSYQSPLLVDLNADENLEIVGTRHGDGAEYYAVQSDGTYLEGWPVPSPGWSYAPPSAADPNGDGNYEIYVGNPQNDGSEDPQPMEVIFGFAPDGSNLPNFPISKVGGNEGVITIADIDNNGVVDLIFTSNIYTVPNHRGFIHAYATDGSGELEGFPIRTQGLTFMNSAILGDIDNDGNLDVTSLSVHSTFSSGIDSLWIDAFDLGYPYLPENIYFNAYKGDNTRSGLIDANTTGIADRSVLALSIYPNPAKESVTIQLPKNSDHSLIRLIDIRGREVMSKALGSTPAAKYTLNTASVTPGIYFIQIAVQSTTYMVKLVIE